MLAEGYARKSTELQAGRRNWLIKYYRDGRPIVESARTDDRTKAKLLRKREAQVDEGVPVASRTTSGAPTNPGPPGGRANLYSLLTWRPRPCFARAPAKLGRGECPV